MLAYKDLMRTCRFKKSSQDCTQFTYSVFNMEGGMDKNVVHPLLIKSVLQQTMEYLPLSDILSCRQVCQTWNKTTISFLRKSKTIKFRMRFELLEEYTQLMKSSRDFPYSQYELEFYYLNHNPVKEFLTTCGKYITSLQLNNCRCSTTELNECLTTQLKNLKSFSINCDPIEDTGRLFLEEGCLPNLNSLQFVGQHCKNENLIDDLLRFGSGTLESLRIRCYDVLDENSEFEKLCFNVFLKSAHVSVKVVENFQIGFRMSNEDLEALRKKGLEKLKYLNVNLKETVRPEILSNLLSTYSKSLTSVDLDFKLDIVHSELVKIGATATATTANIASCDEEVDQKLTNGHDESESLRNGHHENAIDTKNQSPQLGTYKFPKMYSLSKLSLTNFKGSLDFLNDCEVLKYLTLVNCDVSLKSLANVTFHPNLHSLATIAIPKLTLEVLSRIAQLFLHLKELNTDLDEGGLRIVFEAMTELEELYIVGDDITDEHITGITNVFELMTIFDSINYLEQNSDSEDEEENDALNGLVPPNITSLAQISELRIAPSIIRLQNLRKLRLQDASLITDASVRFGLIHCKHLVEISFLNSEVTDCSLRAIGDNLPYLSKLELLHNMPKFTLEGRRYIKSMIPTCDLILGQHDLLNLYRPRQLGASNANSSSSSCTE